MINPPKQATELYKKLDDKIQCLLCPHLCILKEGKSGKCRVRKSDGEKIILPDYGCLTHIAIEPIEKKPIREYLEGTKTLSVGSYSCNLFCKFCLPPNSLISTLEGIKRIDQIEDGEEIFVLDNSSDEPQLVSARVGCVFDRESEEVIELEVDGGKLELTPEHPVMTKNRGWVEAGDLTSDDEVLCDKTCL